MHLNILLDLTEEQQNYLSSCARIRGISHTRLVISLVKLACDDQLIGNILDDDAKVQPGSHFRRLNRRPEG